MLKTQSKISDYVLDGLFIAAIILYFTGAGFLIHGPLLELVKQKPWIHRLGVTASAAIAFGIFYFRRNAPFIQTIRHLPFNAFQWTLWLFFYNALVWSLSACLRHEAFQSSFDLAIFSQALWNTIHNHFLYSSIKGGICLLGDHFSPLLALLALPYALWPDPKNILILQAFFSASAVFPIYLLAKRELGEPRYGLLFALIFALYIPVRNAVRFDFHPEVLAAPFLIWAFYFFRQKRFTMASLFLLLLLSSKENAAFTTAAFGWYAFFQGRRTFGAAWILFSAIYFIAVIQLVMPAISHQPYFYLSGNFLSWKEAGGASLSGYFFNTSTVFYLIKILAPLGFLSFLNPAAFLLALPSLAQNLLARNEMTRSIFFQYTAFLTPAVFISAILGAKRVCKSPYFFYALVGVALLMGGVSDFYILGQYQSWKDPHFRDVKAYFETIPSEASVRTHEFFASHLANRKELHIFENNHPREGGRAEARNTDFVVLDARLLGTSTDVAIQALIEMKYKIIHERSGFYVLQR